MGILKKPGTSILKKPSGPRLAGVMNPGRPGGCIFFESVPTKGTKVTFYPKVDVYRITPNPEWHGEQRYLPVGKRFGDIQPKRPANPEWRGQQRYSPVSGATQGGAKPKCPTIKPKAFPTFSFSCTIEDLRRIVDESKAKDREQKTSSWKENAWQRDSGRETSWWSPGSQWSEEPWWSENSWWSFDERPRWSSKWWSSRWTMWIDFQIWASGKSFQVIKFDQSCLIIALLVASQGWETALAYGVRLGAQPFIKTMNGVLGYMAIEVLASWASKWQVKKPAGFLLLLSPFHFHESQKSYWLRSASSCWVHWFENPISFDLN